MFSTPALKSRGFFLIFFGGINMSLKVVVTTIITLNLAFPINSLSANSQDEGVVQAVNVREAPVLVEKHFQPNYKKAIKSAIKDALLIDTLFGLLSGLAPARTLLGATSGYGFRKLCREFFLKGQHSVLCWIIGNGLTSSLH